jgi:hypothetical protein
MSSVYSPVDGVDKNVLFLQKWTYPQLWITLAVRPDFFLENSIKSWSCAEHDPFFVKLKQIPAEGLRGKIDGSKSFLISDAAEGRPCTSTHHSIGVKRDNCHWHQIAYIMPDPVRVGTSWSALGRL